MTCREKLAMEHPDRISENYRGGCCSCPSIYGYMRDPEYCGEIMPDDACTRCWDREIFGNETKETKTHMTTNEYQNLALKTEAKKDIDSSAYRLLDYAMRELGLSSNAVETMAKWRLLNAALGIPGEAGEVADIVKKSMFQGHKLDKEHIAKELGDIAWYLALAADAIGYDLETIFQMNIDKLSARYPEGFFKVENSVNRQEGDI